MNDVKKLERPQDGRMLAGVCAGIGRYFGVDATLVRLACVAAALIFGSGVLAYVICWIVIPEEGA
jgi:phage shock protein PspC (stress-responsive transcriptional regulator)